ncbi:YeiH family protein [Aquamicrobium zhengzhouense]|uniref:YeiH family protein n=1 Tax=Aquamicrobium zhengzhouense TaxID=2781738 RepID=UPI001F1BC774|nr:putative sulfate exporter family transporter [Aquamicrobium zhengzhouense]
MFQLTAFPPLVDRLLPGFTLVAIVTAAAYGLRQMPGFSGFSPMFSAILIGMVFANFTSVPAQAVPGVSLMGKKLLRLAVAFLGLQLTLTQIGEVGLAGMLAISFVVLSTYTFTVIAAPLLGVDAGLGRLLAAGTSICGASAIAAANAVEQAKDEDVSYAVACVTLFGTIAIAAYPVIARMMELDAFAFGFWTGASVHEVAQVVATGFQLGDQAGEMSVVVKLSRVLLLAPLLMAVAFLAHRRTNRKGASVSTGSIVPVFVIGFIVLMLANTAGIVPEMIRTCIVQATPVALTAALGALGLGTSFKALKARGIRPLLLAGIASVFISVLSVAMLPLIT